MAFFLGLLSGLKSSNVAAGHRVTWRFTFLSLLPASSLTPLLPAVVYPVLHTLPRQPEAWEKGHCSPPSLLPPQGRAWEESIPEPEGQEKGGGEGGRGDAHLPSSCRVLSIVLGPLKVPFRLILRTTLPEPISAPSPGTTHKFTDRC